MLSLPHALYRYIHEVEQRAQPLIPKGASMSKAKARFTYSVSKEAKVLVADSLKVLEAQRAKDLKAGHKATYIDLPLLTALAEASVRGESVEALQAQVSMAYEAGKPVTVPAVLRYQHLKGKAGKTASEVNDRPDNAIQVRLNTWQDLKVTLTENGKRKTYSMAWVKTLQARRGLAYGMKVKATDPEIADLVVFAKV